MKYYFLIFGALLFLFSNVSTAQTGGQFEIKQSVAAAGGAQSANGNFLTNGTIGQAIAGTNSAGGNFVVSSGFWTPSFVPTAATTTISGRVRTATEGIRGAVVTLTDASGVARQTQTGAFGYFRFENVAVGETYIVTVHSKRFAFSEPTRVISVFETITDLDFIAENQF